MKLTPLKVRGKRGQSKTAKKASSASAQGKSRTQGNEAADMTVVSETKRPKSRHGKDSDDAGGMLKKHLPRLSQLPQEMLERVFIASKNLSLPLVNRDLYRRLSNNSIKKQLVGAAFGPTWDAWYGLDGIEVSSYDGWISDAERVAGDSDFQSAILACSWAKMPMLLESYDVWKRPHAHGRVYFTIPRLKEERLAQAPRPGSLYDRAYNTDPDAPEGRPDLTTMTMREKLKFDFDMFQAQFSTPMALPESGPLHRRLQQVEDEGHYLRALLGTHLEVHPGTTVPDDLLRGPFEMEEGDVHVGLEKMQRLFWLVRGGACLQEDQLWEVTREGFREILELVNPAQSGDDEHVTRRVELVRRLFVLFGVLGVFKRQWPKYILQTHILQAKTQASRWPPGSAPDNLLSHITLQLQRALDRRGGLHHTVGWRWRRRPNDDVMARIGNRAQHFWLPDSPEPAMWASLRARRARFFLLAPYDGGDGKQQPGAGRDDEHLGEIVVHEPWSDFGPDFQDD